MMNDTIVMYGFLLLVATGMTIWAIIDSIKPERIKPTDVIQALNLNIMNSATMFSNGKCFQLYLVLKDLWPQSIPWYDGNHVYTEIDGRYYDIFGEHEDIPPQSYILLEEPRIYNEAFGWDYDPIRNNHGPL